MADNSTFLLHNAGLGFGDFDPSDELLHPEMNADISHYGLTETQYFGFSVPEENIHGLGYFWHHANLGVVTGGVMAWQGIKDHHLCSELYDVQMFMDESAIQNGINSYRLDNNYQVEVIEPFQKMRIQYQDARRNNALDITYTAIAPPAMLPNRKHFEQPMRTSGSITLRGKTYPVKGVNVRDRSWAEARLETHVESPPAVWVTGVFDNNFAFNCVCTEAPSAHPEWRGIYDFSDDQALKGGWIYKEGKYYRLLSAYRTTERCPITCRSISHSLKLTSETGEEFDISGRIISSSPCGFWPNVHIYIGLAEWGYQGMTGYGDSQEVQWADYIFANRKPQY